MCMTMWIDGQWRVVSVCSEAGEECEDFGDEELYVPDEEE